LGVGTINGRKEERKKNRCLFSLRFCKKKVQASTSDIEGICRRVKIVVGTRANLGVSSQIPMTFESGAGSSVKKEMRERGKKPPWKNEV